MFSDSPKKFKHIISLGPRCTNTSSVYKAQRKYAGPFDWIFSCPKIVLDCLLDDFGSYLDASAYHEVAKVWDAIGLPPGSASRERTLVGHKRYSDMMQGVGRGVIFNHHNPLTEDGFSYISRCAQRFQLALQLDEAKLYSFINIDRKLWDQHGVCRIFDELASRERGSFLMLAVNCVKNCGDTAREAEPALVMQRTSGRGTLKMFELQCVGENKGSYFQDPFDARRIQALMVEPFTFSPSEDPLSAATVVSEAPNPSPAPGRRRWVNGGERCRQTGIASGNSRPDHTAEPIGQAQSQCSRASRWGRGRPPGDEPTNASEPSQDAECDGGRALNPHILLRSGIKMPRLGLGTWQLAGGDGGECEQSVLAALQFDYPLIDTAAAYKNEVDVGAALRSRRRQEIFLVTKLQTKDHGSRDRVLGALRASLRRLNVEYVDLYLMHSPRGGLVLETWDAMLEARDAGLARAVGVSNFGVDQLQGIKKAGRELPEVNQIECHPWLQQKHCAAWCANEGIAIMAYSPLARGRLFGQTDLVNISSRLNCSEAEAAIRWSLTAGFVVIPKSCRPERVKQNMTLLGASPLEGEVMAVFDPLDRGFQSCAAASNAMTIPWEQVARAAGPRKGEGKGSGKGRSK